jgi:hypothetical protein
LAFILTWATLSYRTENVELRAELRAAQARLVELAELRGRSEARGIAAPSDDLAAALVKAIAGSDDATPARAVISGVQEEIEAVADLCKSAVETEAQVLLAPLEGYARRLDVGLRMLREEREVPEKEPESEASEASEPPPESSPVD